MGSGGPAGNTKVIYDPRTAGSGGIDTQVASGPVVSSVKCVGSVRIFEVPLLEPLVPIIY